MRSFIENRGINVAILHPSVTILLLANIFVSRSIGIADAMMLDLSRIDNADTTVLPFRRKVNENIPNDFWLSAEGSSSQTIVMPSATPCFRIQITECTLSSKNDTVVACGEWMHSIHECIQNLEMVYEIENIELRGRQVKINSGYGPVASMPFLKFTDDSNGGIKITDITLFSNETMVGTYRGDNLDLCMSDKFLVGLFITGGVSGGESRDSASCEEANFTIYEKVAQLPDLNDPLPVGPPALADNPVGKGKGSIMAPSKSPKTGGKGGKGKVAGLGGKYYEYECISDVTILPTLSPSIPYRSSITKSPSIATKSPKTTKNPKESKSPKTTKNPKESKSPKTTKSPKESKSLKRKSPKMIGDVMLKQPMPKSCEECLELMVQNVNEPDASLKDDIFYQVKILTSHENIPDDTVVSALLEVMNGYFKAQLLGCGVDNQQSRRRMIITSIDMTSAVFDKLEIGGEGSKGACTDTDVNCRGAEGRINIYYESEGDDQAAAKRAVTLAVTDLLNENADSIASYVDEVEKLQFLKVDSNRSAIVPPQPISQTGWMIFPLLAGIMLIIYGVFIIIRERRSKSYRNVEDDRMDECLFGDDKMRSDSNVKFPIPVKHTWSKVEVVSEDENDTLFHDELFNRESLARADRKFQNWGGLEYPNNAENTLTQDEKSIRSGYTSEISNEVIQLRYYER